MQDILANIKLIINIRENVTFGKFMMSHDDKMKN